MWPCGMPGLQSTDFPRSFAGGGRREGHCEHGGALMPVISNARRTRAMVIYSMGRGRYKQPMQVSERGQYWRRRRDARLDDVCGGSWIGATAWPEPKAWLLCGASGSGPRAEQRESKKLVGEVGVCAKALQHRTGLVSTTRCHDPGITYHAAFWIGSMDC
jgi:hypothetical protein